MGEKHAITSVLLIILVIISLALIVGAVLIFEPSKTPGSFQADPIPVVNNLIFSV
jgi:hypothetical protein